MFVKYLLHLGGAEEARGLDGLYASDNINDNNVS